MLDAYLLAWADEIADSLLSLGGFKPEKPPSVRGLARKLLRTVVRFKPILNKGEIAPFKGRWVITLRDNLSVAEQPQLIGHELTHWWLKNFSSVVLSREVEEALCDAVGARLAAPKLPFKAAADSFGHRVHLLAKTFHTTQRVALLRIAEVDGRPALLDRPAGRIARGRPFDWPDDLRTIPRDKAHLVRVDDGWGMMAVG